MAEATTWRVVGVDTVGGDLELSALHLYDSNGTRLDDGSTTLTCTATPVAGALASLQDADTATTCRFAAASVRAAGFALVWSFVSPVDVFYVRPGSAVDASRFVASLALEQLVDGAWLRVKTLGVYPWPGSSTMSAEHVAADPLFANVQLLMHADDAIGATTLTDSSNAARTITAYAGAAVATLAGAIGGKVLAANGGYALVPHASGLNFGSADWCVEFDCWLPAGYSTLQMLFNKANATNVPYPVQIYIGTDRTITARSYNAASSLVWTITSASALGTDVRNTIAVARSGSTVRLFINGALAGSAAMSGAAADNTAAISIGAYSSGAFSGGACINQLRLTIAAARRTAAYTPDTAAFPNIAVVAGGIEFGAPRLRTVRSRAIIGASAPVPATASICTSRAVVARDIEFGGAGTLSGTTKVKSTPSNVPTLARVSILRARDKVLARQVWSDPATGAFSVPGLDTRQPFIALAEYPDGSMRPVAGVSATEGA